MQRFLGQPTGAQVRDYLQMILDRRQLFEKPRYLRDALVDLCLATVLISRFARCRAAADGRDEVVPEDVREAISVCELVLLTHVTLDAEGPTMSNLRSLMIGNRDKLRLLLASEA